MSIHKPVTRRGVYFITFTCFEWIPLIGITKGYDLVYNFFDVMKENKNEVLGFVIMPNHVHFLLHYTNTRQSLNTIIGNGKRFIGYEIVKRLEQSNKLVLPGRMKEAVIAKDRRRNKKHELWQGTFEVKECRTEKFILQKVIYIHNNPCTERWKLAIKPHDYPYGYEESRGSELRSEIHMRRLLGEGKEKLTGRKNIRQLKWRRWWIGTTTIETAKSGC